MSLFNRRRVSYYDNYHFRYDITILTSFWCDSLSKPIHMYCDRKISIQISHIPIFHEYTKNIDIYCHLTHHHLRHGTINFLFVSSSLKIVDLFMRTHSIKFFCFLIDKLSTLPVNASWVWGGMLNNILY